MENLSKLNTSEINQTENKRYSKKEELMNSISHIVGAVFGMVVLIMCLIKSAASNNTLGIIGSVIYGLSVITLYTCSAYYHGFKNAKYKKVFRVLDHCAIYLLIAGTYTAVTLSGIFPTFPVIAIVMLGIVWALAILAIVLNAINIEKFKVISMILNIVIGWMAGFFAYYVITAIGEKGFAYIIAGGIIYTVGAILYGIGKKKQYFHFTFHIFCLLGTLIQFIGIYVYCL